MKTQILAEEILTLLCYGYDLLAMPTFRKWNQSYEGWLYQNRLLDRIQYLEAQKFLLRKGGGSDWVFQLTQEGRSLACGGRDLDQQWNRPWDGWWRQFVFDLPVGQQRARVSLLRWLRRNGFGYLQDSVWISPDPVSEMAGALKEFREDAESFTVLECRCAAGFSNAALVLAAWPFEKIGDSYRAYEQFAQATTRQVSGKQIHPRELFALLRAERQRWKLAVERDPLLPRALWPADYIGHRALETRRTLLRLVASHTRRS